MEKLDYTRAELNITEFQTLDVISSSDIIQGEDDMEVLPGV